MSMAEVSPAHLRGTTLALFWALLSAKRLTTSSCLWRDSSATDISFPSASTWCSWLQLSPCLQFPRKNGMHCWFPFSGSPSYPFHHLCHSGRKFVLGSLAGSLGGVSGWPCPGPFLFGLGVFTALACWNTFNGGTEHGGLRKIFAGTKTEGLPSSL